MTLQSSVNLPTLADDSTDPLAHQLHGFIMLVNLFRPFDDAFTATWNKTRGHFSPQYLSGLQKQLNELAQSYACQDASFNDFRTNQQYLKNTVWQLTNGVVSNNGEDSMSFQYPAEMARELLMNMAAQFPGQGMDLINTGLIEKLIEAAYSLTDFLSIQPASRDPFAVGPREHLTQIMTIVAMSRNGDHRFLPLLMSKVADVLPRTVNPMLQNAPENSNLANVDIFDGFGNAGMAQPPPMQMTMDNDYDRKFSVEEYEKKYALEMNGHTPDSNSNSNSTANNGTSPGNMGSDMNTSYVASPGLMSPAIDYQHNMNTFSCNSMSDMVLSPIGNGPCQQQQMNAHMNTMQPRSQNMAANSMSMNGMVNMQQQRQSSFHMQGSGDFHTMPNELDFGMR
jgi:hypothetical protein